MCVALSGDSGPAYVTSSFYFQFATKDLKWFTSIKSINSLGVLPAICEKTYWCELGSHKKHQIISYVYWPIKCGCSFLLKFCLKCLLLVVILSVNWPTLLHNASVITTQLCQIWLNLWLCSCNDIKTFLALGCKLNVFFFRKYSIDSFL